MTFDEWWDLERDYSYTQKKIARGAWNYQQARIEEIIEDIRMACGCTDGDDIRNHLAEYLEGQ
jgi:hypothetical protein